MQNLEGTWRGKRRLAKAIFWLTLASSTIIYEVVARSTSSIRLSVLRREHILKGMHLSIIMITKSSHRNVIQTQQDVLKITIFSYLPKFPNLSFRFCLDRALFKDLSKEVHRSCSIYPFHSLLRQLSFFSQQNLALNLGLRLLIVLVQPG